MGAVRPYKPRKDLHNRFMSKVEFDPNGGCWLWSASDDGGPGYGRFRDKNQTGETQAHRAAYALFCEPVPPGLEIDHKCNIPACVNPAHLEAVTREENMRRASKVGLTFGGSANGARQRAKTHCPQGHEYALTAGKTAQGWRYCMRCKAIKQNARNKRNALKRQES
jgi:hypothetical protein